MVKAIFKYDFLRKKKAIRYDIDKKKDNFLTHR